MTVRWTVRTASGFSAEKRIPLSAIKNDTRQGVFFYALINFVEFSNTQWYNVKRL